MGTSVFDKYTFPYVYDGNLKFTKDGPTGLEKLPNEFAQLSGSNLGLNFAVVWHFQCVLTGNG